MTSVTVATFRKWDTHPCTREEIEMCERRGGATEEETLTHMAEETLEAVDQDMTFAVYELLGHYEHRKDPRAADLDRLMEVFLAGQETRSGVKRVLEVWLALQLPEGNQLRQECMGGLQAELSLWSQELRQVLQEQNASLQALADTP